MLNVPEDLQSGVGRDLVAVIYIAMGFGVASRPTARILRRSGEKFRKGLNGPAIDY